MVRMIHPRGRNCQGRILGKIIFGEREKDERERFWSTPPGETSRELRGSQKGQSVWERDCIGTGSGRGGNPRLFGRMGWGWGWGLAVWRWSADGGGAARRGVLAVQDRHGRGERGRAGGPRCHGCGRLAVCERTAGAYFAGVLCVSAVWVAAGCRGPLISLAGYLRRGPPRFGRVCNVDRLRIGRAWRRRRRGCACPSAAVRRRPRLIRLFQSFRRVAP